MNVFNVTIDNSKVLNRYLVKDDIHVIPKEDTVSAMDAVCRIFKFRYAPLDGITQTCDVKAHLECVDLYRESKSFSWLTKKFPHKQWFLVVRFPNPVGCRQINILDVPLPNYMTLQDAYKRFVMEVNEKKFL